MSLGINQKSQGASSWQKGGWWTVLMPIVVKYSVTRMELWTGCIVLLEMPLTRFEVCWSLPTESLPELLYILNIVTLSLTLWPINFGPIDFLTPRTPLMIPHRLSAFLESLMPLQNWFKQNGRKAVWRIPCVSVTFFLSLNSECYYISFF